MLLSAKDVGQNTNKTKPEGADEFKEWNFFLHPIFSYCTS